MTTRLYRGIQKAAAICLSLSLIWTTGNAETAVGLSQAFVSPVLPPQFALVPPPQLGRIADYFNGERVSDGASGRGGQGTRLVILIQDLHAHYGVQKNIAGLLEFLSQKLAVTPSPTHLLASSLPFALAVEGAQGPIDSSVMALFPDQNIKEQAAEYLMRQGELTGVEYFGLMRGIPDLPVGVEDGQYYTLHRDLFRRTLADRQQLVGILKSIQNDLPPLREHLYGPQLRSLQATSDAFDKGQISTAELIGRLIKEANRVGLNWKKDFPDLAHFAVTSGQMESSSIGLPTPEQLRQYTAEFLKASQSYFSAEECQTLKILAKGKDTNGYFLYLRDLIQKHQLFMAAPVELSRYLEYLHTSQTVGLDHILHDAQDLLFRLKLKMAAAGPEKELAQVEHDLSLLVRMANVQATELEVKSFGPRLNQFVALCQALLKANGVSSFNESRIRELISSSIDYYAMALMRNKPMVDNTLALMGGKVPAASPDANPTLHPSVRGVHDTAVLVAGGFHTESMAQLLRQQHISYIVITPSVNEVTEADQALYIKRLSGNFLTVQDVLADAKTWSATDYASAPIQATPAGVQQGYPLALKRGGVITVTALFAIWLHNNPGHLPNVASLDIFSHWRPAWANDFSHYVSQVRHALSAGATAAVSTAMAIRPLGDKPKAKNNDAGLNDPAFQYVLRSLALEFRDYQIDRQAIDHWVYATDHQFAGRVGGNIVDNLLLKWLAANRGILSPMLKSVTLEMLAQRALTQISAHSSEGSKIMNVVEAEPLGTPVYFKKERQRPDAAGLIAFNIGGPHLFIDVIHNTAYSSLDPKHVLKLNPPSKFNLWSDAKVYTIGQADSRDLSVPYGNVSRLHLTITVTKYAMRVEDNSSKNGTKALNPKFDNTEIDASATSFDDSGPSMKGMGIDNEVPVSEAERERWIVAADRQSTETKTIKGQRITGKFIVDASMDPPRNGSYLQEYASLPPVFVTREPIVEGSNGLGEIAGFHEGVEASEERYIRQTWRFRFIAVFRFVPAIAQRQDRMLRHNAHIVAAARQLLAFGDAWHLDQLRALSIEARIQLIAEHRAFQHRVIRHRLGRVALEQVKALEKEIIAKAEKLNIEAISKAYQSQRDSQIQDIAPIATDIHSEQEALELVVQGSPQKNGKKTPARAPPSSVTSNYLTAFIGANQSQVIEDIVRSYVQRTGTLVPL